MRYDPTPAFVLHARPYRETSFIVDVLTKEHGRVHLIAKGAKRNAKKALLQPFGLIEVAFTGRSDLMTLTQVDALKNAPLLRGSALMCGLYMNELLIHLLHQHEPHEELFATYAETIDRLHIEKEFEKILRSFEIRLLLDLGYGLDFSEIKSDFSYVFSLDAGFMECAHHEQGIQGRYLLELGEQRFSCDESLKEAKCLMRGIFNSLLGHKKLNARELFV